MFSSGLLEMSATQKLPITSGVSIGVAAACQAFLTVTNMSVSSFVAERLSKKETVSGVFLARKLLTDRVTPYARIVRDMVLFSRPPLYHLSPSGRGEREDAARCLGGALNSGRG